MLLRWSEFSIRTCIDLTKQKWKKYPLCTELKICKYCTEFSCFIFINVSETMLSLAKHLCLTFCSSLFCSFEALGHKWDWDQSPSVSFCYLIFFQLKSHFFAVLEWILLSVFCFFSVWLMPPSLCDWDRKTVLWKRIHYLLHSNTKTTVSHCLGYLSSRWKSQKQSGHMTW